MIPIFDLHCDLLGCVEHNEPDLTFESPNTNCSILQLRRGGVQFQTFALATITGKGSTGKAKRQVQLYKELLQQYPSEISASEVYCASSKKLHGIFAIENASGLLEEEEPLERAFQRFEEILNVEKILYVSLTWNQENRFGGGNASKVGLKEDGRAFLDYLDGKKVAVDLSHTSDALARDILQYIHAKGLDLIPIASHSNFRKITNIPRNLPDEIAKEIITMGGIIGMNFVRRFVGDDPQDFIKHLEYGLHLGAENTMCLGADFYGVLDDLSHLMPERSFPIFQEKFGDSSTYQEFVSLLKKSFSEELSEKIAYQNAQIFFTHQGII